MPTHCTPEQQEVGFDTPYQQTHAAGKQTPVINDFRWDAINVSDCIIPRNERCCVYKYIVGGKAFGLCNRIDNYLL